LAQLPPLPTSATARIAAAAEEAPTSAPSPVASGISPNRGGDGGYDDVNLQATNISSKHCVQEEKGGRKEEGGAFPSDVEVEVEDPEVQRARIDQIRAAMLDGDAAAEVREGDD
jgi:hypothetical protein